MKGRIFVCLTAVFLCSCQNSNINAGTEEALTNDSLIKSDTLPIGDKAIIGDSAGHGHNFQDTVSVKDSIAGDSNTLDRQRKRMLDNILKEKMRIDLSDTSKP